MKNIYIIRHGETELNRLGIVQGRGVDTDLNEKGQDQARAFFHHYRSIPFDKIYTSALKRTRQTVDNFISQSIPFEQLSEFDEMNWGKHEGKSVSSDLTLEFNALLNGWREGKLNHKTEGGESPLEVQVRLKQGIDRIINNTHEKNVLLCTHGRTLRILMCTITNTHLSQMDTFGHENTALYLLQYDQQQFKVIKSCNLDHLKDGF